MDAQEALAGLARVLRDKAEEHQHYADFATNDEEAAEHRGISRAFLYVAERFDAAVDTAAA